MNFWTFLFIVCLELLSNATRADDPRETKTLPTKITSLDNPAASNEFQDFAQDKEENKFEDYNLVKTIRSQLFKDQSISSNSKNIQIIVVGKEITLKGPVSSEKDQMALLKIAEKNSAGHTIRNQLEVIRE